MSLVRQLSDELQQQDFSGARGLENSVLARYRTIAAGYAELENAVAVLSDLHANVSYIYYGGFSRLLDLDASRSFSGSIDSIWEKEILDRLHPDDLHFKYLQELRFFHFVKRQPRGIRTAWQLLNRLRMADGTGTWRQALHRMSYIASPDGGSLWLALCLYNPLPSACPWNVVMNTMTGETMSLGVREDKQMLTRRETEILRMIDEGMMSLEIAEGLSISIHTVSRHRQNILDKLRVKNSIEACRIARELGLI